MVAMPNFHLTVRGNGSFSLGPKPTWREGVHPITPEQAADILAWKERHAPDADWLIVTAFKPVWNEPDPLTGLLTLADLKPATRHRPPLAPADAHEPPTNHDDGEPVLVFPCDHCEASFPSAPILRRHRMLHHSYHTAEVEQAARDRIAEGKAAKAAQLRLEHADLSELHPAERGLADESPRPSLWPPLPSEL